MENLTAGRQAFMTVAIREDLRSGVTKLKDPMQLYASSCQLAEVGTSWDGRLRRIARIAEELERQKRNQDSPQQRARRAP